MTFWSRSLERLGWLVARVSIHSGLEILPSCDEGALGGVGLEDRGLVMLKWTMEWSNHVISVAWLYLILSLKVKMGLSV